MKYILAAILILTISACAPDPRDQAEAYSIQLAADQDASDQEQARLQNAEQHELKLQEQRETSAARTNAIQLVTKVASIFGSVAVGIALTSAGIGAGWAFIGSGKAAARLALVRANLLPLDKETRSYPAVLTYAGKGRYTITDPNSGSTHYLDTRNEPDRQLIAVLGAIRLAGVVAQEARKSCDPAGLAVYNPTVISGVPYEKLSTDRKHEFVTITPDPE